MAFIGALSSINTLTNTYSWLSWLDFLEREGFGYTVLRGVITGVLPPVLLALLNLLLPAILRREDTSLPVGTLIDHSEIIALEGVPSKTGVELSLMTRYFIFLVIVSMPYRLC